MTTPELSQTPRTVIISGGASRLGGAIVRCLHREGHNVVIGDVDGDSALGLTEELGERSVAMQCDVRDDAHLRQLVGLAKEHFGDLHGVVNNAVSYNDQGIDSSRDAWQASFDINVVGGARLVAEAALQILAVLISASEARAGQSNYLVALSFHVAVAGINLSYVGRLIVIEASTVRIFSVVPVLVV